jgi:hypothetical protein
VPGSHQLRAIEGGVKTSIPCGEPFAAGFSQGCIVKAGRSEIAEPFKDRAVAELFRIADQKIAVDVLTGGIGGDAIDHMIDTAADRGIVEKVDQRARSIRNSDLHRAAPESLEAEEFCRSDMLQMEGDALRLDLLSRDPSGGENYGFLNSCSVRSQ